MSELLNKSITNKEAADLLIFNKKWAPSVHCSYYSFLQTAIHILRQFGISSSKEDNSHESIKLSLFRLLTVHADMKDSINFNSQFQRIKRMRNRSDYKDSFIDETIARDAKAISTELIKIVNKLHLS